MRCWCPKTADGRVLFAVPWLGKLDPGHDRHAARRHRARAARRSTEEVEFILREAGRYLERAPTRADVRSVWVGLRPLVKRRRGDDGDDTKRCRASTPCIVGRSGLVTVTGGKWTTYRAMAEDVLDRCYGRRLLPRAARGVTVQAAAARRGAGRAAVASRPASTSTAARSRCCARCPALTHWLWRDAESGPGRH